MHLESIIMQSCIHLILKGSLVIVIKLTDGCRIVVVRYSARKYADKGFDIIQSDITTWSRDSVVGIATANGLDGRGFGVQVPLGSRIFSTSSRPPLGSTQPLIQWVSGTLSPG
jgi:hypothetical protein